MYWTDWLTTLLDARAVCERYTRTFIVLTFLWRHGTAGFFSCLYAILIAIYIFEYVYISFEDFFFLFAFRISIVLFCDEIHRFNDSDWSPQFALDAIFGKEPMKIYGFRWIHGLDSFSLSRLSFLFYDDRFAYLFSILLKCAYVTHTHKQRCAMRINVIPTILSSRVSARNHKTHPMEWLTAEMLSFIICGMCLYARAPPPADDDGCLRISCQLWPHVYNVSECVQVLLALTHRSARNAMNGNMFLLSIIECHHFNTHNNNKQSTTPAFVLTILSLLVFDGFCPYVISLCVCVGNVGRGGLHIRYIAYILRSPTGMHTHDACIERTRRHPSVSWSYTTPT